MRENSKDKVKSKSKIVGSRFTYKKRVAAIPQSSQEYQKSMRMLARFIAEKYLRDHPELFATEIEDVQFQLDSENIQQEVDSNASLAA
jgi:hypothetical protein